MKKLARYVKRAIVRSLARARNVGFNRYCPCCRSHLQTFMPFAPYYGRFQAGGVVRPEARCPVCGALERHRLAVWYLRERTDFWDGRPKRMLHVAPEEQLRGLFSRARELTYVSADLSLRNPMVRTDLTNLAFADESFDVIYCSHVLEHVPDDRQAMKELHRVLRRSGWAILQVPIVGDVTSEDPSVTSPEGRLAAFGQHDHVRAYGRDYRDRLTAAGFDVTVDPLVRGMPERARLRMGFTPDEDVYLCRRTVTAGE